MSVAVDILIEDERWETLWPDAEAAIVALVDHMANALSDSPRWMDAEAELCVTLADNARVHELNREWRGKDKPTNVLSFALLDGEEPEEWQSQPIRALGDIILARETVQSEAAEKGITLVSHATHLIMHGILHLLGYDHISESDAEEMERLEIRLLADLGIADPYAGHPGAPD